MDQPQAVVSESRQVATEGLHLVQAFGRGSRRYRVFIEALAEGLAAYEARQGGGPHGDAPTPLPAA